MSEEFFRKHEDNFVNYFFNLANKHRCTTDPLSEIHRGVIHYIYGKYFNPYCNELKKYDIIFDNAQGDDPIGSFFNCVVSHNVIMSVAASKVKRSFWDHQHGKKEKLQSIIEENDNIYYDKNKRVALEQQYSANKERLDSECENVQEMLMSRFRNISDYITAKEEVGSRLQASVQQLKILKKHAKGKYIVLFSYFKGLPVYKIFQDITFYNECMVLTGDVSHGIMHFFEQNKNLSIICLSRKNVRLTRRRDFFLKEFSYISREIHIIGNTLRLRDIDVNFINTVRRDYRFEPDQNECRIRITPIGHTYIGDAVSLNGYAANINTGGVRIILDNFCHMTERKLCGITKISSEINYKQDRASFRAIIVGRGCTPINNVDYHWISVSFGQRRNPDLRKIVAHIARDIRRERPR